MPDTPAITLATSSQPGAVAIVEMHGAPVAPLLERITGRDDWPFGRLKLVDLAGIDQGLAVRLSETRAQVMPHGGPRVVQKLIDALIDAGAHYEAKPEPAALYPEANNAIEADMLAAIAQAASPAAIDRLAAQPKRWRQTLKANDPAVLDRDAIARQSDVLDQLVNPPTVVVVGPPNVGKSTLTNAMLGRAASLVADLPGTTRDWVSGLAELNMPPQPSTAYHPRSYSSDHTSDITHSLAVRWLDTPGLRASEDAIEQSAIELARQVLNDAAVLIAMRDGQSDWPAARDWPREPDLWVVNKCDDAAPVTCDEHPGRDADRPLAISAATGINLAALEAAVVTALGLPDIASDALWAFSPALRRRLADGSAGDLANYLATRETSDPPRPGGA
jgi:small GTP-binding protein